MKIGIILILVGAAIIVPNYYVAKSDFSMAINEAWFAVGVGTTIASKGLVIELQYNIPMYLKAWTLGIITTAAIGMFGNQVHKSKQ